MTELQQKYLEISKDIISVLDDMKSNWDRYPDYLGSAELISGHRQRVTSATLCLWPEINSADPN